jgi:hypothetical protein
MAEQMTAKKVQPRPDGDTFERTKALSAKLHEFMVDWFAEQGLGAEIPERDRAKLTDAQIAATFALLSEVGYLFGTMGFSMDVVRKIALPVIAHAHAEVTRRAEALEASDG